LLFIWQAGILKPYRYGISFQYYFKGYANIFKQDNKLKSYKEILNLQGDSLYWNLRTKYINPSEIAQIYACAGNKGRTLDMLNMPS